MYAPAWQFSILVNVKIHFDILLWIKEKVRTDESLDLC